MYYFLPLLLDSSKKIIEIPPGRLALFIIPLSLVLAILFKWGLEAGNALYAIVRMFAQLTLLGLLLGYIIGLENLILIAAVMLAMVCSSSWIALRTVSHRRLELYGTVFMSIIFGGGISLSVVLLGVLDLDPWYQPQRAIPLASMIFANGMNAVSLAAERFHVELGRNQTYEQARNSAYRAALIPMMNSFFAVGLVTIPGFMAAQIFSEVSPFISARYQMMVMCMLFSSAGLCSACFLTLMKRKVVTVDQAVPDEA